VADFGPIFLYIIQFSHINSFLAGGYDAEGNVRVNATAEGHEAAEDFSQEQVDRHIRIIDSHHEIQRIRRAASHQIREPLDQHIFSCQFLEQGARLLPNTAQFFVLGVLSDMIISLG
jgi:hypothetical protein